MHSLEGVVSQCLNFHSELPQCREVGLPDVQQVGILQVMRDIHGGDIFKSREPIAHFFSQRINIEHRFRFTFHQRFWMKFKSMAM